MEIQIEKLNDLVSQADKILISAEAEKVLEQLLKLQTQVEEAVKMAKDKIEKKALELNPDFKSIQGDRVKIFYRAYGAKYRIDPNNSVYLPTHFYKVSKRYDVIAEEVDKWVEENGGLPLGINEIDRPKSLSISLKK